MNSVFVDLDKMNLALSNLDDCVSELLTEYDNAINEYNSFLEGNNKGFFYDKITTNLDTSFSNVKRSINNIESTMSILHSIYDLYNNLNEENKKNIDII